MGNNLPAPEYEAVRHILASPSIAARSARHIGNDDFDWDGLFAEAQTMSGGEHVLVRIAYDLWEAKGIVGVWEIPRPLDRTHFGRIIDALFICRGELASAHQHSLLAVA